MAGSTRRIRNRVNTVVERVCLTRVPSVIAVSSSLRTYLRGLGVADDKISVIPNAVPVRGPLSERARPKSPWTIGICALFRPRKGMEVLLLALATLRAAGIPVRLRAVGYFQEAAYETEIKKLASGLGLDGAVDWRGFSNDVYEELAQMDLFVLPSLFGEGLPLAILEAMAAGVPVVSTNVEGIPEAVRDGLDGVVVPPGDAEALARGLQRIICGDLDWQALRVSAHRRQADLFSDTNLARNVAYIYDELILQGDHTKRQNAP
jgi:glycosyltransferase involved in cell wall biosynthesis